MFTLVNFYNKIYFLILFDVNYIEYFFFFCIKYLALKFPKHFLKWEGLTNTVISYAWENSLNFCRFKARGKCKALSFSSCIFQTEIVSISREQIDLRLQRINFYVNPRFFQWRNKFWLLIGCSAAPKQLGGGAPIPSTSGGRWVTISE